MPAPGGRGAGTTRRSNTTRDRGRRRQRGRTGTPGRWQRGVPPGKRVGGRTMPRRSERQGPTEAESLLTRGLAPVQVELAVLGEDEVLLVGRAVVQDQGGQGVLEHAP